MESRPRSVLAAFQEHLQLASTKCGSLMEQLNIVRKKVEGKEAMMIASDPVSDNFLENVSQKTVIISDEMDLLDHKDVLNIEQMAVGNAYVERSTGDTNCDVNKGLIIRTISQHSEIIVNKEEVPFLNANGTSNEKERYSLKFDGATNHERSEQKPIKEAEKISGKASLNATAAKEKESCNQDLLSDVSTLSSCSSSDDDDQEASDKQNIYEELLKRLKDNEEKKSSNKNSSSENSSSTFQKSQKTNKSQKKNSSSSTVYEDNFEKKNSEIENLNVGVDFFLPSSVTEKFQEMFYEDSGEEEPNNDNKDKSMRVTFDDLIIGRPNKHSFGEETHSENKSHQGRLLNDTSIRTKVSPNQSNQKVSHQKQNGKVEDKYYDTSSLLTKSDITKKPNTAVGSSAVLNFKLHSPELNLYKRLNGVPLKHELKKIGGRKDTKSKKNSIVNSRLKTKHHSITDPKLKTVPDKKNSVASRNAKSTKNEAKHLSTVINKEEDGGKDKIINNRNKQINNNVTAKKYLHDKPGNEILPSKKVDEVKLSNNATVNGDSLDEILNHKEEVKRNNLINSEVNSKNSILKKNYAKKIDHVNIKEKRNSDSKNLFSKKSPVVRAEDQSIPTEKLPISGKNVIVKEKKISITRTEENSKNSTRTLASGKELSSKHNSVNDGAPPINIKVKTNKERFRPNTSVELVQPKKEWNKNKVLPARKEETFDIRNHQSFDRRSKTKETSESLKGRHHLIKETVHTQSLNEMKTHTTSFPFILGQSTSKTYNVRAAIQQTMSMIMRSPAETLRRSSFSEVLNVSSKGSTIKTSASYSSGRKVCPACVLRVDEEDYEVDDNPIDPWDTEYHSKRFIRCTCMPRNTVNFKTVMKQLLHETSSSYIPSTESYQICYMTC